MPTITKLFCHIKDPVSFVVGEHIYRQDDPADSLFAVNEGEVNIYVQGRLVRTCGPGDVRGNGLDRTLAAPGRCCRQA